MSENCFERRRTLHDSKHQNYFDRQRLKQQKERTRKNSAPTVKKFEEKGCINHELPPKTAQPLNFHMLSLNHSVVTKNNF